MKFNVLTISIFGLLAFLSFSCQNGDEGTGFEDCLYGAPEPIFSDDLPGVKSHQFRPGRNRSEEQVIFSDGLQIVLQQSGCDQIEQAFRFTLPGSLPTDDIRSWVDHTVMLLERLAALGPEYLSFHSWAQAIASRKTAFELGTPLELQPGYIVLIDRQQENGHTILMVTLAQK